MSQHDMTVDNGAGVGVRADLNSALKALVSQSSGASAPNPAFPCQLWADTGTGRLKRRDSANTLWLDIGILDALGEIQTVASAPLTDIGAATSKVVAISGTTTITGLGSIVAGVTRTVRFTGTLLLTYNATSLILPGGASITTAVNDTAEFLSLGGGNWICLHYNPANGTYGRSTIVGTVSQAGGIPTGAIIEKGSNANGDFVKFADGTLICSDRFGFNAGTNSAAGSLFQTAITPAREFPAAFVGVPKVQVTAFAVGIAVAPCAAGAVASPTNWPAMSCIGPFNTGGTFYQGIYNYLAIGKWY